MLYCLKFPAREPTEKPPASPRREAVFHLAPFIPLQCFLLPSGGPETLCQKKLHGTPGDHPLKSPRGVTVRDCTVLARAWASVEAMWVAQLAQLHAAEAPDAGRLRRAQQGHKEASLAYLHFERAERKLRQLATKENNKDNNKL